MPELLVGAMIFAVALGLGFLAGSAFRGRSNFDQNRHPSCPLIVASRSVTKRF
jgi:hypothetical protein